MNDVTNTIISILIGIIFLYSIVELVSNGIGILRWVKMI